MADETAPTTAPAATGGAPERIPMLQATSRDFTAKGVACTGLTYWVPKSMTPEELAPIAAQIAIAQGGAILNAHIQSGKPVSMSFLRSNFG